jgi:hypothetical protein
MALSNQWLPPLSVLASKAHVMLADNKITKQTPVIRLAHGHSFVISIVTGVTHLLLMKLRKHGLNRTKPLSKMIPHCQRRSLQPFVNAWG